MYKQLHIRNLTLQSRDFTILKNIDLDLVPGKFTAIIGPNGAGKSSLLKTLSGEYKDFKGDIIWGDKSWKLVCDQELSTQRATLRQNFQMTFSFEVSEILEMGRYPHNKKDAHNKAIISEVVSYLNLEKLLKKRYHT